MIRGRLLLLGVSLALVVLLLSNTARGLQSVLVASSTRAPSSGTLGHGLLGSVEFDPINPDVYTSASPPPAAAAVSRALASPPPPPPPPPAALIAGKPCAPGCETHGTCNRDAGRCDCPVLTDGESCERNMVPSCAKMWGLTLPIPPCQALTTEYNDYLDFPATCECLAECQALNVRVVYVDNCVNASQMHLHKGTDDAYWKVGKAGGASDPIPYPWRDVFGDGKWLREAYKPGRNDVQLSTAELADKNRALAARLRRDGEASVRKGLCSGRGLFTEVMPWKHRPGREACHCMPGWCAKLLNIPSLTLDPPPTQHLIFSGCLAGMAINARLAQARTAHLRRSSTAFTSARAAACASSTTATASLARGESTAV